MREPPCATPGAGRLESEPDSDAASGDAAVAANMEQVIDEFIWQDGDREDVSETIASAPVHETPAVQDESDIVARLAPRALDNAEWLPRIVTSSLPQRPPVLSSDDRWHLEFASAQHEDDDATTVPVSPPPLALHVAPAMSKTVPRATYRQPHPIEEPSPIGAGWHKAPRVLAAAAAMMCVFSTGVIWATHRSEIATESGSQSIEMAAMAPESMADGDATADRPIRNTPVMVREGETRTIVSVLAATGQARELPQTPSPMAPASVAAPDRPLNVKGGETTQSVPVAQVVPLAPVVRTVPIVPIVLSSPPAAAVPPPALDRDRLADLAARSGSVEASAPPPASAKPTRPRAKTTMRPKRREPTKPRHSKRTSRPPVQSRAAPKVARAHVPAEAWETRRQGLRTDPEPEPSTLKKLIGYVWPFNKSSTAAETAEPPKPAAPAVTARPYSWTDDSRARP
jgi:hypothetical protein